MITMQSVWKVDVRIGKTPTVQRLGADVDCVWHALNRPNKPTPNTKRPTHRHQIKVDSIKFMSSRVCITINIHTNNTTNDDNNNNKKLQMPAHVGIALSMEFFMFALVRDRERKIHIDTTHRHTHKYTRIEFVTCALLIRKVFQLQWIVEFFI